VFSFEPLEMPGIAPNVMQHRLNVDPSHKPFIQKRRHLGAEQSATAATKDKKLLDAGFIREWVSNIALVKKPNGT